ncbi:MAG: hypothetical protein AAFP20_06260, partial [Cyanobacteria bacterium J06614_10]
NTTEPLKQPEHVSFVNNDTAINNARRRKIVGFFVVHWRQFIEATLLEPMADSLFTGLLCKGNPEKSENTP